jgi:pimeloyl-ACP methyl ester carboxylesterase
MDLKISMKEGFVPFRGYKTWYRIISDQEEPGKLPLICLHGGPGATHDYFGSLDAFTATGRRVILYDQLGWGNSDHINNPSMWSVACPYSWAFMGRATGNGVRTDPTSRIGQSDPR